jgi:hypothetical protein
MNNFVTIDYLLIFQTLSLVYTKDHCLLTGYVRFSITLLVIKQRAIKFRWPSTVVLTSQVQAVQYRKFVVELAIGAWQLWSRSEVGRRSISVHSHYQYPVYHYRLSTRACSLVLAWIVHNRKQWVWAAIVFCIRETPLSNTYLKDATFTDFLCFSSVLLGKFKGTVSNWATTTSTHVV